MDSYKDQIISDLQVRLTYMEDDIDRLNKVITAQDKQLQDMQRQLQLLYTQINEKIEPEGTFNIFEERPPHY